jgi:hypothetical protein
MTKTRQYHKDLKEQGQCIVCQRFADGMSDSAKVSIMTNQADEGIRTNSGSDVGHWSDSGQNSGMPEKG